jgi:hypothetical protein
MHAVTGQRSRIQIDQKNAAQAAHLIQMEDGVEMRTETPPLRTPFRRSATIRLNRFDKRYFVVSQIGFESKAFFAWAIKRSRSKIGPVCKPFIF